MTNWKTIPIATDYQISDSGDIRKPVHSKTGPKNNPKIKPDKDGYEIVHLSVRGRQKCFRVHRLVALTFIGESPFQVHHKNGVKSDNRVENLEYVTPAQNRWHGTNTLDSYAKGQGHPNSKLNAEQVEAIHALRKLKWSGPKIANVVGCTSANVYTILKGKGWGHIDPSLAYSSDNNDSSD